MNRDRANSMSGYFDAARNAPSLMSEQETRTLLAGAPSAGRLLPVPFFALFYRPYIRLAGAIMSIAAILAVFLIVFDPGSKIDPGRVDDVAGNPSSVHQYDGSGPQRTDTRADRKTAEVVRDAPSRRFLPSAVEDGRGEDSRSLEPIAVVVPVPKAIVEEWAMNSHGNILPDPDALPRALRVPDEDSVKAVVDTTHCLPSATRRASSFYGGLHHLTRSYSELNKQLASAGFSTLSEGETWGSFAYGTPNLLNEYTCSEGTCRPFPVTMSGRIGFEFMKKGNDAISADGKRLATMGSWSLTAEGILRYRRVVGFSLVLGVGYNLTTVLIGRNLGFEEALRSSYEEPMEMTQSSLFFRPAIRCEPLGLLFTDSDDPNASPFSTANFGLEAGYAFTPTSKEWRIRSGFELSPGLPVSNSPSDSYSGWYLGGDISLRF